MIWPRFEGYIVGKKKRGVLQVVYSFDGSVLAEKVDGFINNIVVGIGVRITLFEFGDAFCTVATVNVIDIDAVNIIDIVIVALRRRLQRLHPGRFMCRTRSGEAIPTFYEIPAIS
jgi:hypothetical protein